MARNEKIRRLQERTKSSRPDLMKIKNIEKIKNYTKFMLKNDCT